MVREVRRQLRVRVRVRRVAVLLGHQRGRFGGRRRGARHHLCLVHFDVPADVCQHVHCRLHGACCYFPVSGPPPGLNEAQTRRQALTSKGMERKARRHCRRKVPAGLSGRMPKCASSTAVSSINSSGRQLASHCVMNASGLCIACIGRTRCAHSCGRHRGRLAAVAPRPRGPLAEGTHLNAGNKGAAKFNTNAAKARF